MSTAKQATQVHEDIPIERAWQTGRRIYVACAYESTLGAQLRRELGAHWDGDIERLWVGSGKKERVIAAVRAADARRARVDEIMYRGRSVEIPFQATDIRARANELDAVWDGHRRVWCFGAEPEWDDAYNEVATAVANYNHRRRAQAEQAKRESAEENRRYREAREARAEQERVEQRKRVLAESGRIPTGDEDTTLLIVSTQRMNKTTALGQAHPLGTLVRLEDGRRGIVVDRRVWFTNSEFASSICWHLETHDAAHWDLAHTVVIVEPTAQETAEDDAARADMTDATTLRQLVEEVRRTGAATQGWTTIDDADRVGVITCWYYSMMHEHRDGTLILTRNGRAVFQHPGWYDDYIPTERVVTDPDVIARVSAAIEAGDRTRHAHDGQMSYRYQVTGNPTP
ncbi:hypothetical protein [Nocardia sp. CNY236]|uniref:hypothetical protein n=1 Tax=Nocardia sp. CNY236 TaxID=1169152 RepID=UPI000409A743|nr:hypothetical protein [Nocardia sp. CNY236]